MLKVMHNIVQLADELYTIYKQDYENRGCLRSMSEGYRSFSDDKTGREPLIWQVLQRDCRAAVEAISQHPESDGLKEILLSWIEEKQLSCLHDFLMLAFEQSIKQGYVIGDVKRAIIKTRDTRFLPLVMQHFQAGHHEIELLGAVGDATAIPILQKELEAAYWQMTKSCCIWIGESERDKIYFALASLGDPGVFHNVVKRAYTFEALHHYAAQKALDDFKLRFENLDSVLSVLFSFIPGNSFEKLRLLAMHGEYDALRRWAIEQLSEHFEEECHDFFVRLLPCPFDSPDPWITHYGLVEAIVRMKRPPLPELYEVLAEMTEIDVNASHTLSRSSSPDWILYTLARLGEDIMPIIKSYSDDWCEPGEEEGFSTELVDALSSGPTFRMHATSAWLVREVMPPLGYAVPGQPKGTENRQNLLAEMELIRDILCNEFGGNFKLVDACCFAGHCNEDGTLVNCSSVCQVVTNGELHLHLSEYGRFARFSHYEMYENKALTLRVEDFLTRFHWQLLSQETLKTTVKGLFGYYYGAVKELTVDQTVFWFGN